MAFDFDMPNIAGNYVVNIKDFSEPTLLKVTWIGMGTISHSMREQCLDSGGNYVLAYDTAPATTP
jgi:hypothetical protein